MSRREAVVKAVASAIQPDSLDLTQFRQRSARDTATRAQRELQRLRREDAAAALAYSALQSEEVVTDPLASPLLRMKYAGDWNRELFRDAHRKLLERFTGARGAALWSKVSETLYACATAALFEWLHDHCPKCRFHGKSRKGSRCPSCRNSGRISLTTARRWELVSDYIGDAQVKRGDRRRGLDPKIFKSRWSRRYLEMLEILRTTDRLMGAAIDLRLRASDNRAHGAGEPAHK